MSQWPILYSVSAHTTGSAWRPSNYATKEAAIVAAVDQFGSTPSRLFWHHDIRCEDGVWSVRHIPANDKNRLTVGGNHEVTPDDIAQARAFMAGMNE